MSSLEKKYGSHLLEDLDGFVADQISSKWLSENELCIFSPGIAREVFRNKSSRFERHADFWGQPGACPLSQIERRDLALDAMKVAKGALKMSGSSNAAKLANGPNLWPDRSFDLLMSIFFDVLVSPNRSGVIRRAVEVTVERNIKRRFDKQNSVGKLWRRISLARAFTEERARWKEGQQHKDLLDLVFSHDKLEDGNSLEIFMAFVFSLISSLSLTLSWSLLLALKHERTDADQLDLVKEAARLFPIAWMLERKPVGPTEVDGHKIDESQTVLISPYALHRSTAEWDTPNEYRPERWKDGLAERSLWVPFSMGETHCIAASFSMTVVAGLLDIILKNPIKLTIIEENPRVSAALYPPSFITEPD